ncbi:CBS domain-containing protein [Streptomyces galbus]|uniref:CBS domain-containing protein n=2 Tax=Streptomyces galbus TaxID=33898 RepID=A0A4V6AZ85_STRGB|nr:CBS domain-containing protein [Streptomyces galbus]
MPFSVFPFVPEEIPLRVSDDMTVEVALAVMAGARVEHLAICDGDDENTGCVSLAQLAGLRESAAYTDRVRLRDVLDGGAAVAMAA